MQIQFQIHVLDNETAVGSSHDNRLQYKSRRFIGLRDNFRSGKFNLLYVSARIFILTSESARG